jgi:hypothetical protein
MKTLFLIIISLVFVLNCKSYFYNYKITTQGKELQLDVKKIPKEKKKILFLTEGYLDEFSDMLKHRGHSVTVLTATEENLKKAKDYDSIIIFKSRKYDLYEPGFSSFLFLISVGIIPGYIKSSNDYEFILLSKAGKQEIAYSFILRQFEGWLSVPIYWLRNQEKSSIIPNTESYLLLCSLVEEN